MCQRGEVLVLFTLHTIACKNTLHFAENMLYKMEKEKKSAHIANIFTKRANFSIFMLIFAKSLILFAYLKSSTKISEKSDIA